MSSLGAHPVAVLDAMAYATSTDMLARYDERTLSDLLSDSGSPATVSGNSKLTTLLSEASGRVNAAIRVGNTYTADQIADLTGDGLEHLIGITCQIAWLLLLRRRPEKYGTATKQLEELEASVLDRLRDGERIFDLESVTAASVIEADQIRQSDVTGWRGITTRTRNYYPPREGQLPEGR